jgi:protein-L-isoaspartate(D-aspartate) O-methyltransferase
MGGRLVMPVGSRSMQQLMLLTKTPDGYEQQVLDQVVFVPMLGGTE